MRKIHMIALLSLLVAGGAWAQDDVIAVSGTVYNKYTDNPEPYCFVKLLRDLSPVAACVCDSAGSFFIDSLPAGTYTLNVGVGKMTLFSGDFDLYEPVRAVIYVDTIGILPAVPVVSHAPKKHLLGYKLITSPDDGKLWNFSRLKPTDEMPPSGPASKDLSGRPYRTSRLLAYTVPVWVLFNEPPLPSKRKQPATGTAADTAATPAGR